MLIGDCQERVVAKRYVEHVELNHLFPARQSAYRHHHSSETAVVSLVNDLIRAVDGRCLLLFY